MTRTTLLARRPALVGVFVLMLSSPAPAQKFEFAYTTSFSPSTAGKVSVINTATNRVIATIPVGVYSTGIAAAPDGTLVYVANAGPERPGIGTCDPSTVSVIDTAENQVTATIPVGRGAHRLAVTPNGAFLYVANGCSQTVSVISTATNAVTATIQTNTNATEVAITPDGAFAYVTNALEDNVTVINTSTNGITTTIPVGGCPWGIAFTPDGAFAYVVNAAPANVPHGPVGCPIAGDGSVSVIDTATNRVVATVGAGLSFGFLNSVTITPDGASAYVGNCGPAVCVIDTTTNTVTATFKPGSSSNPTDLAFSGDGGSAYIAGCTPGACVIDTATNTTTATINTAGGAFGVAVASVPLFSLDHFKVYKARKASGASAFQRRTVTLMDAFETKSTTVLTPTGWGTAVDKNGEGRQDSAAHLECYKIKDVGGQTKFTARNLIMQNQFGHDTLTLKKPQSLCVPAGIAGQAASASLPHFKCYTATIASKTPKFVQRTVSLLDEFETKSVTVRKPTSVCTPVGVDGAEIADSRPHLECYQIRDVNGQAAFSSRPVAVQNEFGTENLLVKKADTLCVPSLANEP